MPAGRVARGASPLLDILFLTSDRVKIRTRRFRTEKPQVLLSTRYRPESHGRDKKREYVSGILTQAWLDGAVKMLSLKKCVMARRTQTPELLGHFDSSGFRLELPSCEMCCILRRSKTADRDPVNIGVSYFVFVAGCRLHSHVRSSSF